MREVLWRAGVSQKTLYGQFAGLPDASLRAFDAGFDWILGGVEEAVAAAHGRAGVREGLRCLLERLASEPELAWCCFAEVCAVGPPGRECRVHALERLAVALGPAGIDARPRLSVAEEMVAGGVWYAIESKVLAGQTASLISLLPELERSMMLCGRELDRRDRRDGRGKDV